MGRDIQMIAGAQHPLVGLMLKPEPGAAGEQQYPFTFGLVVPEARRAGLATGDDALDAQTRPAQKLVELLARRGGERRKGREQVLRIGVLTA